ncbi:N-acetyl sugar amidotransferase [Candidatus Pelagibacter communis]|jgi:N-acetyl sugar amidotransferase|uniref:N-acetyl sugar amidotransferase n=1 Tax=Pelagibacter ubique TaxID=198252 RepID=UPI00036A9C89|nr:N-acetyl sugar amidotransferase [Candidatus Pelagibacter ubique]
MKKNSSLFGLSESVIFCSKCVISNQRPRSVVEFKNKDNIKKGMQIDKICDACKFNETKNKIDWEKREAELIKLLDKHRKPNGYDCVVPGSGGKDSAFTAHILKYKYNMNPLTVTWAPHMYTDIGWKNFDNWTKIGGFDNILFTPNGRVHKLLTKLAFENLLHPFQPFIIGQKIIGPLIAKKFNIPLIFYGENQAEYGNAIEENSIPEMDEKFFSIKDNSEIVLGGVMLSDILKDYDFKINDFEPYLPPSIIDLKKTKIVQSFLGYYLKWDPQECYYYAAKNTGFKPNTERTEGSYSKYSSIDDKIDPFHYYTTFIKFGIGRASYDASQEIRNEKITRDEGINLVRKYDDEFPNKYFYEFLDYIDITEEKFYSIIDSFRSPHLWKKENSKWKLLQKI